MGEVATGMQHIGRRFVGHLEVRVSSALGRREEERSVWPF